ncbi:hypothetical protein OsJ_00759 [Oryza sativa Japonica Group]|uniref:Homeobox domain-containing protein n=1 Tax=Oryza sativa subsp. japonica TaxID=39947 RepID=A2ZQC0_ORYSJ|nr:hypothetical protein OsJ_00759 [Oryza sativa Japonica Group]
MDASKYVRYTPEQVEALERLYYECPKPSSLRRQQLVRECPALANVDPKQIKVWFQNRRCREKQRKESSRLQALNRKLTAMNKLLMEENDRLQKQVSQLVYDHGRHGVAAAGMMRRVPAFPPQAAAAAGHQLATATDTSCESVVTSGHHHQQQQHNVVQPPPRDASPAGLMSIAEETLTEFLSKATGTAVEWLQMPGMKPGPDSIGIIAISHGCAGVAARACGLVGMEPAKVAEILKDRPLWLRDCRSMDVDTSSPNCTLDLASTLEAATPRSRISGVNGGGGGCAAAAASSSSKAVMTIAFQFAFDGHLQDSVAAMARQYMRNIISSVQRIAVALSSSRLVLPGAGAAAAQLSPVTPEAATLPRWICQSYRFHFGDELIKSVDANSSNESILKAVWHHPSAILCCSLKAMPVFTFANQSGLDMLETTLVALQDMTLEKVFDDQGRKNLCTELPNIMEQGMACMEGGVCVSSVGRAASYEKAVAWKVVDGDGGGAHCICFMFINWTFL